MTTALQRFGSAGRMILEGQVIVGACVSNTVIVKAQVAVLPALSVTRKTLVVEPPKNVLPDGIPAVCIVLGLEQLSVPTGVV